MAGNSDARDGVALARSMYLFGLGNDGVPCRSRARLLEVSTVHPDTLAKHVKRWEREADEIAKSAGDFTQGFGLREDVLAQHAEDVDFLRRATDSFKTEFDNADEIQMQLWDVLEGIRDNLSLGPDDFDSVSRLLSKYLDHSANRKTVLASYLAAQKRWQDASAMSATLNIWEVQQKELAKRAAKAAAGPESPAPSSAGDEARRNTEIFAR